MQSARIRREQVCARCRNHGVFSTLKGHKKICTFLFCKCSKCEETKIRQKFIAREIAFHRRNSKTGKAPTDGEKSPLKIMNNIASTNYLCEVRRNQMCARCRNHGEDHLIRGHKNLCRYSNCTCEKCQITKERRKIMAKQIKDYRTSKVTDDGMESFSSNDFLQIKHQEETDQGYFTGPNNSPEADVEMISFPTISEKSPDEPENSTTQTIDLTEKPDEPEYQSLFNILPPEILNTFFMVESLYEKYCLKDCNKKIQFVYAFVLLAQQNWESVERSLERGLLYSEQFYKYHQQMASENLSVIESQPPLLQLLPQHPSVRVKPMNGKF